VLGATKLMYTSAMEAPSRGRTDRSERGAPSSVSARSRSRKTSDSGASLLSNSNLELVLELIDDYYQRGPMRGQHGAMAGSEGGGTDVAALLGNFGPRSEGGGSSSHTHHGSHSSHVSHASPTGARSSAAEPQDENSRIIARALIVATTDAKRLEELLRVMEGVPAHARRAPGASRAWLAQLDEEVHDTTEQLHELLGELREIHQSLIAESRPGDLTSKLALLASWQESVLTNPLVQRARMHMGSQSRGGGMQTAHHFLLQHPAQSAPAPPPTRTTVTAQPAPRKSGGGTNLWPFSSSSRAAT